jgi:hypothetical protein
MNQTSTYSYASFSSNKGSTHGQTSHYSFQESKRSSGLVYRNRDEVLSSQTTIFPQQKNSIIKLHEVTRDPSTFGFYKARAKV